MKRLTLNFNNITNATDSEKAKLLEAKRLIEHWINTEEFKDKVCNHLYNGEKTYSSNEDLTNEQIYEKIMEGAEVLLPEKDGEIDVDVTVYQSSWLNRGVLGYTFPNTVKTWINRRFLSLGSFTAASVAGNIIHEWLHKLGFTHDFNSTARRPFSVPYAIGYMIRDLCKKKIVEDDPELPDGPTPPGVPSTPSNPVKRLSFWQKIGRWFRNIF